MDKANAVASVSDTWMSHVFVFDITKQSKSFLPRVADDEAYDAGVASSPIGRAPDEGPLFCARIDCKPRFCKDDPISDMISKNVPIGTVNKKPCRR